MAPEQGHGSRDIDHRADIYSLGVMIFALAAGELPFTGESPLATILKHVQEPVPSVSALNAELPSDLDDVLKMAMAKKPEDRLA